MLRLFLLVVFCLYSAVTSMAQQRDVALSIPIDAKPSGIYKVLAMDNGSTLLFHLDIGKALTVKFFDSTHRLRATREYNGNYLDVNMLRSTLFKGLFEVNGEAVLFLEETHLNRNHLLRFRFSGTTGALIEEEMVGESRSLSRPTRFYVMYNLAKQRYAILYSSDVRQFKTCDLHVSYFNEQHNIEREVVLPVDRKKYDQLYVTGADWHEQGVAVVASLSVMEVNGTRSLNGNDPVPAIYQHTIAIFTIPDGSDHANVISADLGPDFYPFQASAAYNPFAHNINIMLLSYRTLMRRFGIDMQPVTDQGNLFFSVSDALDTASFKWMEHTMARSTAAHHKDSSGFRGLPVFLNTDGVGLTTFVSTTLRNTRMVGSHVRSDAFTNYFGANTAASYDNIDPVVSQAMYNHRVADLNTKSDICESYFGNIAITQLDDNGQELGAVLLPRRQYIRSYRNYYPVAQLAKGNQEHYLFNDQPPQVWQRQFIGQQVVTRGSDTYVLFNDFNGNFRNSLEKPGDTVFSFEHTNPVYYKVSRKREVEKKYLFGESSLHEFKPAFIEGASYNERRNVYATLVQYTRGEYTALKLAWTSLD